MTELESIVLGTDDLREDVEDASKGMEALLSLKNKTIKEAATEQIEMELVWKKLHGRVNVMVRRAEEYSDRCLSYAYKNIKEKSKVSLSPTEIKNYVLGETGYADSRLVLNDVLRVKEDTQGVIDILTDRRYILKDLTNLVVSGNEGHIL